MDFSPFTRKYALSKTLRFELRPVGRTQEHLIADNILIKDESIEKAYQVLKPVFDRVHEDFITKSLTSHEAKKIDFSPYLDAYKMKKDEKGEKKLRAKIGDLFSEAMKTFNEENKQLFQKTLGEDESEGFDESDERDEEEDSVESGEDAKKKTFFKKKNGGIYMEKPILKYIYFKASKAYGDIAEKGVIQENIKKFANFFVYLGGFNQNRANYYETNDIKKTSIATRIIHENLPKFCDNILAFQARREAYLGAYDLLQDKTKKIRDGKTGEMVNTYAITEDYFEVFHYNACLSQEGIEDYNRVMGHYNSIINLYNQQQDDKKKKLSGFKTLFKQIGCGKRSALFFQITDAFEKEAQSRRQTQHDAISVEEILTLVSRAGEKYFRASGHDDTIETVYDLISDLETRTEWKGYYWSKAAFNTISNWYFSDWQTLAEKLQKSKENPNGIFEKTEKKKELETGEKVKIPDALHLEDIFSVIDNNFKEWKTGFFRERILEKRDWRNDGDKIDTKKQEIFDHAARPSEVIIRLLVLDMRREIEAWEREKSHVLSLTEYKSEKAKEGIKTWLDHIVNLLRMTKYFSVPEEKIKHPPMDSRLAEGLKTILYEAKLDDGTSVEWFRWYDGLRNYLTKKVGVDEKENKLKLNFENATLGAGWDVNKESSNSCVILESPEGKQFLAIMKKGKNMVFQKEIGSRKNVMKNPLYTPDNIGWKKMEYKLLPGPNKMLPKCLMPGKEPKKYGATDDILSLYKSGAFKKGEENFDISKMHRLIDFYKEAIKKYEDWGVFNFSFLPTGEYQDISAFYLDVERQGYRLYFTSIHKSHLDTLVETGDVYLFEIRNQDSNSRKSEHHKNNLHTIYWRSLFTGMENRPKLNGEAEVFYRKAVPLSQLQVKKDQNGHTLINKKLQEVIEGFRFSQEKFLFHVPITLNFSLRDEKINDAVNTYIQKEKFLLLGLDRGEKHLVYYSLIDSEGNIRKQGSLNLSFRDSQGNPRSVKKELQYRDPNTGEWGKKIVACSSYNDILDCLASNRDEARKNWKKIGTIKEMKEGYISQVVHEIVEIATQEGALIILEDLNTGFKRGRQKIEKSIYQKFEGALAKKLNFIVDKKKNSNECGSVTHALQLTPPVNGYGDIEKYKQVGIMFYTRANYTSQTDPLSGWRRSLYLKYDSKKPFDTIREYFTTIEKRGERYSFITRRDAKTGISWEFTSEVDRYTGRKNSHGDWEQIPFNVTKTLDELFKNIHTNNILESFEKEKLLKPTHPCLEKKTATESLIFTINILMQIRNSSGQNDRDSDFLHSPVIRSIAESGEKVFTPFDSRKLWDEIDGRETDMNTLSLPSSGDANGAYNIARKGVIMTEHIRAWKDAGEPRYDKNSSDLNLFVSDEEWDLWLTNREQWRKVLPIFASRKAMENEKKRKS